MKGTSTSNSISLLSRCWSDHDVVERRGDRADHCHASRRQAASRSGSYSASVELAEANNPQQSWGFEGEPP